MGQVGYVTCMSWFPHTQRAGRDGIELAADIRMLAVGYTSGKVGPSFFDSPAHQCGSIGVRSGSWRFFLLGFVVVFARRCSSCSRHRHACIHRYVLIVFCYVSCWFVFDEFNRRTNVQTAEPYVRS